MSICPGETKTRSAGWREHDVVLLPSPPEKGTTASQVNATGSHQATRALTAAQDKAKTWVLAAEWQILAIRFTKMWPFGCWHMRSRAITLFPIQSILSKMNWLAQGRVTL